MKHVTIDSVPESYRLGFFGDLHFAVKGFPMELVKRAVRKVRASKHYYLALGGDMIDSMLPSDPRYIVGQYMGKLERVGEQARGVVEILEPVADRILWGIQGNHERRVLNTIDVTKRLILEPLGVEVYGKDEDSSYLLKAQLGDLRVLDWHGSGMVRSNANDDYIMEENERRSVKKKLRRLPGDDCELLVMHHIHKMRVVPPSKPNILKLVSHKGELKAVYPTPSRKYIDDEKYYYDIDDRWYASSGAFFPNYVEGSSSYGEVYGFRPTEMGWVTMLVEDGVIKDVYKEVFG